MIQRPFGLENALLGFLNQEPQHGYQLHQRISDPAHLGLIWRIKQSQLYALLVKLEDAGYVSSSMVSQESRPPRKVFALTKKGQAAYLAWLTNPVKRPHQIRQEFIAKLYFALIEGKEEAFSLIERQQKLCFEWLTKLDQGSQVEETNHLFVNLVYQYRIGQVKAILNWLDELRKYVETSIQS